MLYLSVMCFSSRYMRPVIKRSRHQHCIDTLSDQDTKEDDVQDGIKWTCHTYSGHRAVLPYRLDFEMYLFMLHKGTWSAVANETAASLLLFSPSSEIKGSNMVPHVHRHFAL